MYTLITMYTLYYMYILYYMYTLAVFARLIASSWYLPSKFQMCWTNTYDCSNQDSLISINEGLEVIYLQQLVIYSLPYDEYPNKFSTDLTTPTDKWTYFGYIHKDRKLMDPTNALLEGNLSSIRGRPRLSTRAPLYLGEP